jgi:hypothetical protein
MAVAQSQIQDGGWTNTRKLCIRGLSQLNGVDSGDAGKIRKARIKEDCT